MKKWIIAVIIFCLWSSISGQGIDFDDLTKDVGTLEQVYRISVEFVAHNSTTKNAYFLRADTKRGMTVKTSKKTLTPNDTSLITVEFIPEKTGAFKEDIKLVVSTSNEPIVINVTGTIKSIKPDDKTACYYFKKKPVLKSVTQDPIVVTKSIAPKDVSNKLPDNTIKTEQLPLPKEKDPITTYAAKQPINDKELDNTLYKSNNIVFVVDVSSSMKDSSKLPVMKQALYTLIESLRDIDKVTFITYADSVKLIREGLTGSNKEELTQLVKQLKAKGLTKGNKAILFGLDIALRNYIEGGNNQLLLVTDGKFRFYSEDYKTWQTKQVDKSIILSTVAFGNDRDAMDNLKEIAKKGKGSFIHIKNKSKAREVLLNEIKDKSKK